MLPQFRTTAAVLLSVVVSKLQSAAGFPPAFCRQCVRKATPVASQHVKKTLEQLAGNGYTARLLLPAEFIWRVFRF